MNWGEPVPEWTSELEAELPEELQERLSDSPKVIAAAPQSAEAARCKEIHPDPPAV